MNEMFCELHKNKRRFHEALIYTSTASGFSQRLIEKDYFCSLLLHDFRPLFESSYVFKGGTCLSKVHAKFYRMSEDLDFAFSIAPRVSRKTRRMSALTFKDHVQGISSRLPEILVVEELSGRNENRQYSGKLAYHSVATNEIEPVKIELSLREQIIEETLFLQARTILADPAKREALAPVVAVNVMSLNETFAEKVRASVTRRIPAIRDFFDVFYAQDNGLLDLTQPTFIQLVKQKLAIPGHELVNLDEEVSKYLHLQLESRLKPVLSETEFLRFKLDKTIAAIKQVMRSISRLEEQ